MSPRPSDWQRFWSKVDASGDCWEWKAGRNQYGYGIFYLDGKMMKAHRVARTLLGLPNGEHTDHLCRNRGCVNPDHTEAVTASENSRRAPRVAGRLARDKPFCKWGHPRTPENLATQGSGTRYCKICNYEKGKRRRERLRVESEWFQRGTETEGD